MSGSLKLSNTEKIDFIGMDENSGVVILSLIDDMDWNYEKTHILQLQNKIMYYLDFLKSEKVFDQYPCTKGRIFEIKIYFTNEATLAGHKFLKYIGDIIQEAGHKFSFEMDVVRDTAKPTSRKDLPCQ